MWVEAGSSHLTLWRRGPSRATRPIQLLYTRPTGTSLSGSTGSSSPAFSGTWPCCQESVVHNAEGNKAHGVTAHCSNPHCCRKTLQKAEKPPAPPWLYEELTFTHQVLELAHFVRQIIFQVVPEDHSSKGHCPGNAPSWRTPLQLGFTRTPYSSACINLHLVLIKFQPPIVFTFLLITIKTNRKGNFKTHAD